MYNITTTDNKIVHNVEYYTFSNGKIKSIETFFGTGVGYPGNSDSVKSWEQWEKPGFMEKRGNADPFANRGFGQPGTGL